MKDEHDKQTGELLPFPAPRTGGAALPAPTGGSAAGKKFKRLPQQRIALTPHGAKPLHEGSPLGFGRSVVPVSSVAREWGISARRVRTMLMEGRLDGRQKENGYWEVYFPYRYVWGTRGPQLTRNRNLPERSPYTRKKRERFSEW